MKEQIISEIAIYLSWIFFIVVALLLIYAFFTGDVPFISGGGTADDCVPNPIWGGCDM